MIVKSLLIALLYLYKNGDEKHQNLISWRTNCSSKFTSCTQCQVSEEKHYCVSCHLEFRTFDTRQNADI